MTGAPLVLDRPALRDALAHMRIRSPEGDPFEEALARDNGWSLAFAERVADEYRGFLYLAATAGFEVTPSECVDRAWHLHLTYPHYRERLCGEIVGRLLEHRPGTGAPDEDERYRDQYEQTLALYEQVFGNPPPADIWPNPRPPDSDEAEERASDFGRPVVFGSLFAGVLVLALGAPVLGIVLAGAGAIFYFSGMSSAASGKARDRNSGSCGGGGCGGGTADSSDDCGASCGGASCGGSCGGGGCGGD